MNYIINSTFIPCDGIWKCSTVSQEFADTWAHTNLFISAMGHSSTAQVMSMVLGVDIPMNRLSLEEVEVGSQILCFKLKRRAPEGVILTIEEIEEIGYEWKLLTLLSKE